MVDQPRAVIRSIPTRLVAFRISAEDGAHLAAELGGGLDEQDLLELGDYQAMRA